MASTIRVKRSSVPGKVPNTSVLSTGELALNLADKRLYSANSSTTFELGSNPHSLSVGAGSFSIANGAITFPTSDGTASQVLVTDGSGQLSFADQSGSSTSAVSKLDSIAVANGTSSYSLTKGSVAYVPGSETTLLVSVNGTIQKPGTDFTVSGSTIGFQFNLVTGVDEVDFIIDLGTGGTSTTPTLTRLDPISAVNGQATYNLLSSSVAYTPSDINSLRVARNGVLQEPTTDFTISGSTITFIPALFTGEVIDYVIDGGGAFSVSTLGNPSLLDSISVVNGQASYSTKINQINYSASGVNNLIVSLNGVIQEPTADYTVSGSTITFIPALATGDVIDFIIDLGRTVKVSDFATTSQLDNYLQVANANFVTQSSLDGYLQVANSTSFASTSQLDNYLQVANSTSFASTSQLDNYLQVANSTSFATTSTVNSNLANTNAYIASNYTTLWSALTSTNTSIRSAISTEVANLVDSAPTTLDTLNELAAALGDDANFAATTAASLGTKAANTYVNTQLSAKLSLSGGTMTGTISNFAAGTAKIARPSTFWATEYVGISNYGSIATQGNYDLHITSNGYRNSSGTWTSFGVNGKTGAAQIALDPDGEIGFNTDASKANGSSTVVTRRVTIDADGNVGIGETSPDSLLHLKKDSTDGLAEISYENDARHYQVGLSGALGDAFRIYDVTNNRHPFFITGGGNVGIGDTAPDAKLKIKGGTGTIEPQVTIESTAFNAGQGTALNFSRDGFTQPIQARISAIDNGASGSNLIFSTKVDGTAGALTERMQIDSNGKLTSYGDIQIKKNTSKLIFGANTGGHTGPHGLDFYDNDNTLKWGFYYRTTPETLTWELGGTTKLLYLDTSGHLYPGGNGTQDLGTSSLRWGTVYTSDLSLKNEHGDWTIVEGEDDLFLYNNKKGKVYKFALTEVDPDAAPPKRD